MKAIMISIKPKWCAKIMNGEKIIEVRKNKALANAIQKLIDENGYADIYVYCTKEVQGLYWAGKWIAISQKETVPSHRVGKVVFKFRCYKVEEIEQGYTQGETMFDWYEGLRTKTIDKFNLLKLSCLAEDELKKYLDYWTKKTYYGYAIHISNLEIFDEPKELWDFETTKQHLVGVIGQTQPIFQNIRLTKAPQNFCYVEVE